VDEIATKSIIIGVSIFVTMMIATVVLFEFSVIADIYESTGETDITFEEKMDEFNKYKDMNNEFNGLDVRNTVAKYKNNGLVDVCIGELSPTCNDSITISENEYKDMYSPRFTQVNGRYLITFIEK